MEPHFKLSDDDFEIQFEQGSFPLDWFSHEAHLRLAWIHLKKYGLEQAIKNIQKQLQHFVKLAGAEDKYHSTLTVASVNAVHHFIKKSSSDSFQGLVEEFPALKSNFMQLIQSHYGFDLFQSSEARTRYMAPDLQAF